MIALKYTQSSNFDKSSIPEDWQKYVSVAVQSVNGVISHDVTVQVSPEDSSYRYRALKQKPQLVLKFALPFFIEFPTGTTCVYQNQRFILTDPENLKKQGSRNIEYTMTLGTNEDYMAMWKFRNTVDRRMKFSMCAKPHEFVEEIVKNLNARDKSITWQVGECIESAEKTVEFNHVYIDAALTDVANVFETEYEVEYIGLTKAKIHLRKVEYFKDSPVALSYGKGNGFIPGVGRSSEAGGQPVKRMYVQGSDRNIDRSKYGAPELLLPKSQTLEYEGRTYKSDADGYYIERIDVISTAIKEDSLDCSEIYPSRVGTVSSVIAVKPEKNYYDIIDNSIPSTLNFNDYIIAGESMTLIFQSGMLAGKEFDVKYKHDERRFEIVPQEYDGVTMPNETFKPKSGENGDTYAIFGIMLPSDYICNNTEKTGASWDMFRAAAKALYECEDQKFTFSGQLQALWTKRNWLAVGGHLVLGGYVLFTDNQFAPDGVKIRITGIKDYVNSPYSPTIELSNSVSGASMSSTLREINNTEVVIDDTKRNIIEFTKRRFRDAKETIEMLEEAMLDNFTHSISPITVQTMAMLVGDESLQFVIGNNILTAGKDDWQVTYNQETKQLHCPKGWIKHMTLGIDSIKASHTVTEYMWWQIPQYQSPVLNNPTTRYYLYAKVSRTDRTAAGVWVLSPTAISMESAEGYYHLLVGILNSESDGERSFVQLNGFTEILPGRITADRIVCSDGESFLDLAKSVLVLGDAFDYNSQGDKTLRLKFLLSENANLGGWIFRNNRLESQSGNVWLDGQKGDMRLAGTVQLSANYTGNYSDSNLFYLPQTNEAKHISMGYEAEDIGKVVRLFNSNPFGGKSYIVHLNGFKISGNVTNATESKTAEIAPQETIEVTCFKRKPEQEGQINGFWTITNRFGLENFRNKTECGRYPQLIASGTIYGKENPQILGTCFDGKSCDEVFEITRQSAGNYTIKRKDGKMISSTGSYHVMLTGIENDNGHSITACYGRGSLNTGVQFRVVMRVANTLTDGYANFMIFTTAGWEYEIRYL